MDDDRSIVAEFYNTKLSFRSICASVNIRTLLETRYRIDESRKKQSMRGNYELAMNGFPSLCRFEVHAIASIKPLMSHLERPSRVSSEPGQVSRFRKIERNHSPPGKTGQLCVLRLINDSRVAVRPSTGRHFAAN